MGQLQIPGTSVQYSNPKQVDQSTVVFPDCGDLARPGLTEINPQTGLPTAQSSRKGRTWQPAPVATGTVASWNHSRPFEFPGPSCPQPGAFDPAPVTAPPIAVNQDPPVPNKGTPVVTTKNPDGSTASAHGTIAGTSITFNSPA